jgi:hypothetical protein
MKDIIDMIHKAFTGVPRPALTMADAEVADNRGDESSRFEEHDKTWWEIPDELIARYSTVLCYLPPEAELYYLPAYMSWFLRTGDTESASTQHLMTFLNDPDRLRPVWKLMTEKQKQAVLMFPTTCAKLAKDEFDLKEYEEIQKSVEKMPNPH